MPVSSSSVRVAVGIEAVTEASDLAIVAIVVELVEASRDGGQLADEVSQTHR
jgi:hypothetical protein